MIDLSIIIVSYNNLQVLKDCLDSVFVFNDIGNRLEVIVVEQSPTDIIYSYLIDHYPNITVIRAENKGFGAGNNRGAEVAHGKYLLFLNPDTILIEPVAQFAVDHFDKEQTLGLFGVRLLNSDHKNAASFDCTIPFGYSSKFLSPICNLFGWYIENKMYIQGADLFIRADLFKKIGAFDEDVFMYFEEPDLCIRIRKENYHIKFFPNKKIIHLQGASTSQTSGNSNSYILESFKYVCNKYDIGYKEYLQEELTYQKIKLWFLKSFRRKNIDLINVTEGIINAFQFYLEHNS